jgi:hypothetical protein
MSKRVYYFLENKEDIFRKLKEWEYEWYRKNWNDSCIYIYVIYDNDGDNDILRRIKWL